MKSGKAKPKYVAVLGTREHKKQKYVVIVTRNQKRISTHGFGLFIEGIKPGELLVSKAALKAVNEGKCIRGLCPMEIFPDNMIGFCDQWIPISNLSVHEGAAK